MRNRERIALWWILMFGTLIAAIDMIYLRLFEAAFQTAICGLVAGIAICMGGSRKKSAAKSSKAETSNLTWINTKDRQPEPMCRVLVIVPDVESYMVESSFRGRNEPLKYAGIEVEWWRPQPKPPEVMK